MIIILSTYTDTFIHDQNTKQELILMNNFIGPKKTVRPNEKKY